MEWRYIANIYSLKLKGNKLILKWTIFDANKITMWIVFYKNSSFQKNDFKGSACWKIFQYERWSQINIITLKK